MAVPAPRNANPLQKLRHAFGLVSETLPASSDVGFYFRWISDGKWSADSPSLSTVDGGAVHSTNSEQAAPWRPSAFPRRGKSFGVRINTSGPGSTPGTETLCEFPNPFAGTTFPVWTPEPFPSEIRVGDLPVVVEGWTFSPEHDLVKGHDRSTRSRILSDADAVDTPTLVMRSRQRPDLDIVCVGKYLSDATGNAAFRGLPYSESAWKVDATIEYGRSSPVTPEHQIYVGRFAVPGPTDQTQITVPDALGKHRVVSAILSGPKAFLLGNRDAKAAALILKFSSPPGDPLETITHKRAYSRIAEGRCRKIGDANWSRMGVESPFRSRFPVGQMVIRLPETLEPGTEFELELLRSEVVFTSLLVPPPPAPKPVAEK